MDKIDGEAVEIAINAARDALSKDRDSEWIGKSSLTERAYYMGLLSGLSAIAQEDVPSKRLAPILMKTLFPRAADDTFPSTSLGQSFAGLEHSLRSIVETGELDLPAMEAVEIRTRQLDQKWRNCHQVALKLLTNIRSEISGFRPPIKEDEADKVRASHDLQRVHMQLEELGITLRFLSLLETHHELSKRFE